ncbi:MAG TPA: M20 family peptidase, partial [Sulfurimonas autotrophica]|nr:M20 family peptidase [Sulfurimonas autotrophica]
MNYIDDLKKVVEINSYTKNKEGVDTVGKIFDSWFTELGFVLQEHPREHIGNHRHYTSPHIANKPKLLLLGHIDTVFPPG